MSFKEWIFVIARGEQEMWLWPMRMACKVSDPVLSALFLPQS